MFIVDLQNTLTNIKEWNHITYFETLSLKNTINAWIDYKTNYALWTKTCPQCVFHWETRSLSAQVFLEGLQPVKSSWWLGYPWPVARSALNNTYTYIHTHIHTLHSITDHLCTSKISSRHTHQSLKPAPGLLCVCVRTWPFAETLNVNTARLLYYNSLCLYGFGLCREVRVKTEKILSGPGTKHKPTAYSSPHLFKLTFEQSDVQWCLKTLSRSVHGASWSSSQHL